MPDYGWILASALLSSLLFLLLFVFAWKTPSKLRNIIVNIILFLQSLAFCFGMLELIFYEIYIPSSGWNFTLSGKRWRALYWNPINSQKYRDIEWNNETLTGKKVVAVFGDSFTAGHGVKDYQTRYTNVLGRKLGDDWVVLNIARNGWNTRQQLEALKQLTFIPNQIVLAYFLNDIGDTAEALGVKVPCPKMYKPEGLLKTVLDKSYFLNYAYWGVYRFGNTYYGECQWQHLKSLYTNQEVWRHHQSELQEFINISKKLNVKLSVIIFPHLLDIEGSSFATHKVNDFFRSKDIPTIDLSPVFAERPPKGLTASNLDAHPNARVHTEVGALVYNMWFLNTN